MEDIWLIYNPRSRTSDDALVADVERLFFEADRPITRKLVVGEDSMPDGYVARMAGVKMIVALSGDGTISDLARALENWNGTLVVLPGGTMNLLSHALHGDLPLLEIVAAALAGKGGVTTVPTITTSASNAGGITAYAGIIVGPSSAWADVREDMRNFDLMAIGADAKHALEATLHEPGVTLEGAPGEFPAVYLEPGEDSLKAYGVRAESAAELLGHGWAWLKGDFRNGPCETLPAGPEVTLSSAAASFDLLVDGEKASAPNPVTFRLGRSELCFYSAQGGIRWS